jgi:hypothetical protein
MDVLLAGHRQHTPVLVGYNENARHRRIEELKDLICKKKIMNSKKLEHDFTYIPKKRI